VENVDERDDDGQAGLPDADDAAEPEENSLLVLLHDPDGERQEQHRQYDDDDEDPHVHVDLDRWDASASGGLSATGVPSDIFTLRRSTTVCPVTNTVARNIRS
jgi:hypothetical protein